MSIEVGRNYSEGLYRSYYSRKYNRRIDLISDELGRRIEILTFPVEPMTEGDEPIAPIIYTQP